MLPPPRPPMDNLTHTLLATALAKTPLGRRSPLSAVALVVAANFPDVDAVSSWFGGRPSYLIHHRGITHSIAGVALGALLLTALFSWCERWSAARAYPSARGRRPGPGAAVAVGIASHPMLDWLNTYGVRPWLPFDGTWIYGDAAFIVDPWLWLLFGAATAVAGPRTRLGSLALAAIGAFATWVVFDSDRAPGFLRAAWPFAIGGIVLGRSLPIGRARPGRVVGLALAACAAYVLVLRMLGGAALGEAVEIARADLAPGERIVRTSRSPQPADPRRWVTIVETDRRILRRSASLSGSTTVQLSFAKGLDDPVVREAAERPEARAWRVFARHPFAKVETDAAGKRRIFLLDARYQIAPGDGWSTVVVE